MTKSADNSVVERLKNKLPSFVEGWDDTKPARVYFSFPPSKVRELVSYLVQDLGLRFIIASGLDTRKSIEILYHFSDDNSGAVISARTILNDKNDLKIDSISDIFIGAAWIEREIHELLGVDFPGNNNLKHLLLKDDWPEKDFPLRHDND
jgi:NADH:ubiquinone oxidoreductase subunit C